MTQKGLILKIENDHILVLNKSHQVIKLKLKAKVDLGQKIYYSDEDLYRVQKTTRTAFVAQRKVLAVASIFICILMVGGLWGFNGLMEQSNDTVVATIMNIDINPSVQLALNHKDVVLSVKALNDDAETLDFTGIVGQTAETAIEKIVELAKSGGFIDEEDLIDDYILITTIPMNKGAEKHTETLKIKITEKVAESDTLQEVNVALIKATKVEMREAEDKKVPVGLYVVKGTVTIDDEPVTVKEFFSSQEGIDTFKTKGEVVDKNHAQKEALAQRFIDKLAQSGYPDTGALQTALDDENNDIDALLAQVKSIWASMEKQKMDNPGKNKPADQSEADSDANQPKDNSEHGPKKPELSPDDVKSPGEPPGQSNDENKNKHSD